MTGFNIYLVDHTGKIDPHLIVSAAAALNIQVNRDLASVWPGTAATVGSIPHLAHLPHGAVPVFLVKKLPPGEGGFHSDKANQPFAKIIASPHDDTWTIDASHEIVELLVDPYGNRMQTGNAIQIHGDGIADAPGTFNYLVEAADPVEANNYAYDINGIAVSDFITPHFYDAHPVSGLRYSFQNNLAGPRRLQPGGYISYQTSDGRWQQILWVDPSQPPSYNNLNADADAHLSLRERFHRQLGDANEAKFAVRHATGGLPAHVAEQMAAHAAHRARDHDERKVAALTALYDLD